MTVKQERTVKTPCCGLRVLHKWPRGELKIQRTCTGCGALYELTFDEAYNGRTGRLQSKRVMHR